MDKKTETRIKLKLRELSYQCSGYERILKEAKRSVLMGKYKNGKDKFRIHYMCAFCKKNYLREEVQVDHMVEVGQMDRFDLWIARLFCDSSGLQILCTRCHLGKTNKFMKAIRTGTLWV